MAHKKIWQSVKYEKLGFYCSKCRCQGHIEVVCRLGQSFVRGQEERKESVKTRVGQKIWHEKQSVKEKSVQIENGKMFLRKITSKTE